MMEDASGDGESRKRSVLGDTTAFFCWPAWGQPLNVDGIDALLDLYGIQIKQGGGHQLACMPPGGALNMKLRTRMIPPELTGLSGYES